MRMIPYVEYKRRVFNKALLECFSRIHLQTLSDGPIDESVAIAARNVSGAFFSDELSLKTSTIASTKARLSEAVQFIQDCVEACEGIACDKAEEAKKEKMEIPEDQAIELSAEDKNVIDQLFDEKSPKLQVDQVRNATVQALLAEDKKSEEIRNAVDVAKAQADENGTPETLEETVKRLNQRGPTSLMHAILNNTSRRAVQVVTETSGVSSVGEIMADNATQIKDQAIMIYSLYETASVFGIKTWTPAQVKALARDIYYEK